METYHPFIIRIHEESDGRLCVTAEFQGVERSQYTNLSQLKAIEISEASQWVEKGQLDEDSAQDLGRRLFHTLLPPEILGMFREAQQRIGPNERLRIVLNLPMPEALGNLPWELIYDAVGGFGYVSRSRGASLLRRYSNVSFPHAPPKEGQPLRVLIVTASPRGLDPLSKGPETEQIIKALDRKTGFADTLSLMAKRWRRPRAMVDMLRRGLKGRRYEVTPLHYATRKKLLDCINNAKEQGRGFHVVHVISHGMAVGDDGVILLESEEDDRGDPVSAIDFAELVDSEELNLVILNACETAKSEPKHESVAMVTIKAGVPAVIGMQVSVLDRVAVDFAREFYRAWAAGEPIEEAVAYARHLIRQLSRGAAADWSIPVLYMGHTGGLALPRMKRAHHIHWAWRRLVQLTVTVVAILGAIMTFLAIPDTAKVLRTEIPPIRRILPYPMSSEHNFNILITPLPVVNEVGETERSRDGRALAEFLYQRLDNAFLGLDLQTPYEIRGPGQSDPINGETADKRREAAAELAESINAHVVIYGRVIQDGGDSRYEPEFFVNYKGFEQAEQIVGPHAFGSELYLELPFEAERYQGVSKLALSERVKALGLIAIGIAHYHSDDPTGALPFFQQAEATSGWSREDVGKAVIYALLGHTYLSRATANYNTTDIEQAGAFYEKALNLSPDYVRARSGKAEVLYLQGRGVQDDPSRDVEKLKEARNVFEAVLSLDDPELETIAPKVWYSIGRVYWYLDEADDARSQKDHLSKAEEAFMKVIDAYVQNDHDPRLEEVAGHAHGWLGLIAFQVGATETAEEHYRQAIMLISPRFQAAYYKLLGDLYKCSDQFERANQSFERAQRIALFYADDASAERYDNELSRLQELGADLASAPECAR